MLYHRISGTFLNMNEQNSIHVNKGPVKSFKLIGNQLSANCLPTEGKKPISKMIAKFLNLILTKSYEIYICQK